MKKLLTLMLGMALLGAACSSGPFASDDEADLDEIELTAALQSFDDCDAFLDHVEQEALERVGPYGLEGADYGGPVPLEEEFAMEDGVALDSAEAGDAQSPPTTVTGTATEAGGEGSEFSGTNVQVAGVDEPDIVKTDGNRVLAIADATLHIVDVSGDSPTELGAIGLDEGTSHEMLVVGDRVYVFGQSDVYTIYGDAEIAADDEYYPDYPSTLTITEIDISEPSEPTVTTSVTLEGSYLSARLLDGTIRLVTSTPQPTGFDFVTPSGPGAEDVAEDANRKVIEDSTIDQWLPAILGPDGERQTLIDCSKLYAPGEFSGFSTLSVMTIDGNSGLGDLGAVGVMADGETVYSAGESLYVSTNRWVSEDMLDEQGNPLSGEEYSTAIHKFDTTGSEPATYLASGSVRGHVLNQFSMDELEGNLRVATTDGDPWGIATDSSQSFVTVLAQEDDQLVEIGQVGELGPTEEIQSVRFVGDVGYVVTFRQTDPLYTIDLSDPTKPAVVGELKILGYSAYLHPAGDGLLIGVGQDATEEGTQLGTKISLFDVSDPAHPSEVASHVIAGGSSDVEFDHRAFLYWPDTGLVVIPVSAYGLDGYGAYRTGAIALSVTGDAMTELGWIVHGAGAATPENYLCDEVVPLPGPLPTEPTEPAPATTVPSSGDEEVPDDCYYPADYGVDIERSMVIGEEVFTLSSLGLKSNDLASLADTGWLAW